MVQVNCDYIPAWPIVYYKTKENYKRETNTIFHLLWPLFVWTEKAGDKLLALLYILFRLTYKESIDTQFVDLFWPIIHYEFNQDGFRFGIRPLCWIISGKGEFKFSFLGIINIFSKDDGNKVWFTIAPFIWYRYNNGNAFWTIFPFLWIKKRESSSGDKWMVLLLPLGLLRYHVGDGFSLNIALLFNISVFSDHFSLYIIPFLLYRNKYDSYKRLSLAILFYYSSFSNASKFKRFVIFPILWSCWSDSKTTFNVIPFLVYMRRSDSTFLSVCFLYYYRKISDQFKLHIIPLLFLYQWNSGFKFLNIGLLYNYWGDEDRYWHILLPVFWYKMKKGSHFFVHVWPFVGYKKSHDDHGSSVYFIYPFIQFNSYDHGDTVYNHVFYRFIHYYRVKSTGRLRHGFLPLYAYSNSSVYNKGHILLYMWYFIKDKSIKNSEIIMNEIISPTTSNIAENNITPGGEGEGEINLSKPSDNDNIQVSTTIPTNSKQSISEQSEKLYSFMFRSFLPFAFYLNRGDYSKLFIIPLFYMKWSLTEIDSTFLSIIFYQRKQGTWLKRFVIPVLYQKHTEDRDIILSPFYYYYRNLANSFRLIAPLFIDVHKGETHLVILVFPTFIYYRKSIFKFVTLFPFYFLTEDASKNETFTYYFPFYGKSLRGSNVNRYFFFPIFRIKLGRDESKLFSVDFLYPLFHYESNGTDNSHSIRLLPFFWKSKNDYNEMLLIMPLFWRFITDKDTRPQRNTLILPFYYFRDSAEYMFTFASPAFLPPYYIHYHREASNVENTYLFPIYSHQIRGLDHLKWVFWILYRHKFRDYSENFTMNILLYFKHNSDRYSINGLIPLWVYWKDKLENGTHLRVALLIAYDKVVTKLKDLTRYSVFWFVTTHLTLFCRQNVVKRSVAGTKSIADEIGEMMKNGGAETNTLGGESNGNGGEDGVRNINHPPQTYNIVSDSKKTYLWPLFHTKSDSITNYYHFAFFWFIKPFISLFYRCKESSSESLVYVFLAFYYKTDISSTTLAIVWFFHPLISCFLYENSPFSSITRMFPVFWYTTLPDSSKANKNHYGSEMDTMDQSSHGVQGRKRSSTRISVKSMAFSLLYIVPNYGLFNLRKSQYLYSIYMLPLFYYLNSNEGVDQLIKFSLLWIAHPLASIFNYTRHGKLVTHRMVPVYYRITTSEESKELASAYRSLFSLIWFAHPFISFIRYDRDSSNNILSIFPLFWRKYSYTATGNYHLSLLYIVRGFGFIDYYKNETFTRFYILLVYFFKRESGKTKITFIYPIHPKASLITAKFTPDYKKVFVFLAMYFKSSITSGKIFSVFWIVNPKVAFLSYWSKHAFSHFHIVGILWISTIEEYIQFGLLWIGATRKSMYSNHHVNQEVDPTKKINTIYKPISLFLAYNDGEYKTVHLMPFFRYWSKTSSEMEKFWGLIGMVYFSARRSTSEFRLFYRWIRVKTSDSVFVCEFNPFVAYKKKIGKSSTVLILGGMCGCYSGGRINSRVCCIEC